MSARISDGLVKVKNERIWQRKKLLAYTSRELTFEKSKAQKNIKKWSFT